MRPVAIPQRSEPLTVPRQSVMLSLPSLARGSVMQFRQLERREVITLLGGAVAWPLAARAEGDRVRRIGVLTGFAEHDAAEQSQVAAFRGALTKLGWIEGSNLRIELRSGGADPDRTRMLAKELVGLQPDAILSLTTLATSVLAVETRTIPIVFAVVADPIGN